jgi:hypothetical protein
MDVAAWVKIKQGSQLHKSNENDAISAARRRCITLNMAKMGAMKHNSVDMFLIYAACLFPPVLSRYMEFNLLLIPKSICNLHKFNRGLKYNMR